VKPLSRSFAIVALVIALLVPSLSLASASPAEAWGRSRGPSSGQAVDWLADSIALTQIELGPLTKKFVNFGLKLATPVMCPIVAGLAAPDFQTLVKDQCLAIGQSADPWAQLQAFTPVLCSIPGLIFPDYEDLFVLACKFLV
jgi:hypothetical protein